MSTRKGTKKPEAPRAQTKNAGDKAPPDAAPPEAYATAQAWVAEQEVSKTTVSSLSDQGPVDIIRTEGFPSPGLLIFRETSKGGPSLVLTNMGTGGGFKLGCGGARALGEYLTKWADSQPQSFICGSSWTLAE